MVRIKHTAVCSALFFCSTILSVLYAADTKQEKVPLPVVYQMPSASEMRYALTISNKTVTLENNNYTERIPPFTQLDDYQIKYEHKIPFLCDSAGEKIFLILKSEEVCFLFKNNNASQYMAAGEHVFGALEKTQQTIYELSTRRTFSDVSVSSFLKEEATATRPRISYEANNLIRFSLDAPWVENVPGQGIGEKIRFSTYDEEEGDVPAGKAVGFYVCSGFISFVRPDLYEKNSRVKEFKVTDIKTQKSKSVYLEDTPNPQLIDISEFEGTDVELEIKDVYPGTRWQDICVAGIVLKRLRTYTDEGKAVQGARLPKKE